MEFKIAEEDIQRFLFLLDKTFENDNNVRSKAEKEINSAGNKDIVKSTLIFSEIVLRNEIPINLVFASLSWLKKIFTPVPPITEYQISQKWLAIDDKIRNRVKMAIFKSLMFTDIRVLSMASKTFAALLNIEKLKMFDLIPQLYKLIENPEYSDITKAAAINVLAEISGPKSLGGQVNIIEVQQLLLNIFMHIGTYFSESQNKSLDIRFNIVYAIDTFLDVATPLFKGKDTVYSLVDLLIQNLENIPIAPENSNTSPDSFHSMILSILYKIIKIHYDNSDFDPAQIFQYTIDKIINFSPQSKDQSKIANLLQFWTDLAKFEYSIIKRNRYIDKMKVTYEKMMKGIKLSCYPTTSVYKEFCEAGMKKMVDKLFHIMLMINPNDTNAENIQDKELHMFATCCLQSFFKINPIFIFDNLKRFWYDALVEYYKNICSQQNNNPKAPFESPPPLNWIRDHALLLSTSIMCRKVDEKYKDSYIETLEHFFFLPFAGNYCILKDYIIGTCLKANQIAKITDTCLFSLSIIFRHYPSFLTPEIFNILLDWIVNNRNTNDPIIFLRILILISTLCDKNVWFYIKHPTQRAIMDSFQHFVEIFHIGTSRPDAMTYDLYRTSYSMMSSVCFAAIISDLCWQNIASLLQSEINKFNELLNDRSRDLFTKITTIINLINSIYRVPMKIEFIQDFVDPIVNSYSKIISPNSPFFEEALLGLGVITRCINDNHNNLLFKVSNKINDALTSGSPSIITDASYMRASLYEKFITNKIDGYQELLNQFPSNYDWIVNGCLSNTNFTRDFYPLLLKALSLLISSCSEFIQKEHPEIIDSFIQQYQKFASMPLVVKYDEDVNYANIFYDAMFTFASAILKCIPKDSGYITNRKLHRLFMDKIPTDYLKNLQFRFSNLSLNSFLSFLNQYNITFGTKGNIILHRRTNFDIILHALCNSEYFIKEKAENVLEIIKKS